LADDNRLEGGRVPDDRSRAAPGGQEADARAVQWAVAKFKQLGFDKVWTEPVTFPQVGTPQRASAQVLGAHAQPLMLAALGGSPGARWKAMSWAFPTSAALQAAPAGSLAGKIAFVDYRMQKFRDGHDYRNGGGIRHNGPSRRFAPAPARSSCVRRAPIRIACRTRRVTAFEMA
jgi:hypothetical protein